MLSLIITNNKGPSEPIDEISLNVQILKTTDDIYFIGHDFASFYIIYADYA